MKTEKANFELFTRSIKRDQSCDDYGVFKYKTILEKVAREGESPVKKTV